MDCFSVECGALAALGGEEFFVDGTVDHGCQELAEGARERATRRNRDSRARNS